MNTIGPTERATGVQPRPEILALPLYRPGTQPKAVPGRTSYKLSSNESPFPPLPEVQSAVARARAFNLYPDPSARPLREELSVHLEVPVEHIVAGTGSLAVLNDILQAFAGRRSDGTADEVVYPWRSFESYPISIGQTGAHAVPVPLLPDFAHDLDGMLAAITDQTRVIILCSPNNPTGSALSHTQVREFLRCVPAGVVVVLDEAYQEYARNDDPLDALGLYREFANVVVLRTFSKAHGLAALRVGYCVAQPPIAGPLNRIAVPFAVAHASQVAAIASLRQLPQVLERVERTVDERERLARTLCSLGLVAPESHGNFLWLPLGAGSSRFARMCADHAVSVREFAGEGVRVSIGVREANERVVELYRDIVRPSTARMETLEEQETR